MFGVLKVNGPIAPEPLLKATDVVPVIVPVPVMVPEPVAVIVSTVPETLALITMPLFAPVLIKLRVPVAVIVFVNVIAPAPLA